jgi:hypothetical protein
MGLIWLMINLIQPKTGERNDKNDESICGQDFVGMIQCQ